MKHRFLADEIEKSRKRVEITFVCIFIIIAVVIYLITDSYFVVLIIPLYRVVWMLLEIFGGIYLEHLEGWKEWEIERIDGGIRFHHKETGSTVRFSDLKRIEIEKDDGVISSLTLNLKNGHTIGIKGFSDMDLIYQHLVRGVEEEVILIG